MADFVAGQNRGQSSLLPECLDDWVDESNPVRVIDAFVASLDLRQMGFDGLDPAGIGRPAYHPKIHLKLYIYGYLNRVQSSRRLEREAGRNLEVMWLLGRLAPDFKTIADFRKDVVPEARVFDTTAQQSRRSARSSSRSAASSICLPRQAWRSTAANSKR